MLRVLGGVKQRGQNPVDGIQAQFHGQVADRTYVSKNAAIPCVGIKSSLGRVLILRQVTPQEDDSRSLDRISQVGRPAVDADEEHDYPRLPGARLSSSRNGSMHLAAQQLLDRVTYRPVDLQG